MHAHNQSTDRPTPTNPTQHSSTATPGARGARYRYLSAFEVAAAGGEKLKAALRSIYEGRPRRTGAAAAPMTTAATTTVRMAPAPGGGAAAAAVRGFAAVGPSLGGRLVRVPSSSEIKCVGRPLRPRGDLIHTPCRTPTDQSFNRPHPQTASRARRWGTRAWSTWRWRCASPRPTACASSTSPAATSATRVRGRVR